ncbi:MAG TPA: hypothetical protein DCM25_06200 [Rhodobacteraceae bacterium]|nr:hypothetical protein [Paracoccaceae bacterium]|tara:strand:+ start:2808 stop:3569 length:762 start_codon:yes stop_codon:yes gene_type:complete
MSEAFNLFPSELLILIAITAVFAGMVKGIVGFGMPMILISGMTVFINPNLALGILILPTLVTNGWQAGRQGFAAAFSSVYDHRWFLGVGYAVLLTTTQMVPWLSQSLFFLCLGILVVGFAGLMLSGWQPRARNETTLMIGCALVAGTGGGISGVWGPPTVMYLSMHNLDKQAQMRAQGVIYGLGAILLLMGHIRSGIATPQALILGGFSILPACFGIWIGFKIQDRINQNMFRVTTLIVLIVTGLNLIRRGLV